MDKPSIKSIDKWVSLGWLSHLDRAFVRFLLDQEPAANNFVLWGAALVSNQLSRGEVYLDLEKLCQNPKLTLAFPGEDNWRPEPQGIPAELSWISATNMEDWKQALSHSSLVSMGQGNTPLVLDGNRLYLRRYWQYQQTLNAAIEQRLQPIRDKLPEALQTHIKTLFSANNQEQPDWQKIACALALRAGFTLITGGPGTGKTTTLTKLLALLIKLAQDESNNTRKLNIVLAAPTGKAAARVSESIGNALNQLDINDDIKQCIPKKASTLHRLLGSRHDSRLYVRHRNTPLVADIVIVDEASMIDLEIMAALMDALPESALVILLGDKDQLASVEAGSVMGDLCRNAENSAYGEQTRAWIKRYANEEIPAALSPGSAINQQTIMLRYSHRFGEHSGIGQLAKAVNVGDVDSAIALFDNPSVYQDINRVRLHDPEDDFLKQLLSAKSDKPHSNQAYGHYLDVIRQQRPTEATQYDNWARQVLEAFDKFRVLSALRKGVWGAESLNERIEKLLFPNQKPLVWYEGRPVMVTRNDYNLGLMNGDVGIALYGSTGKLQVAFPSDDTHDKSKILWISPMRLPEVETAFAITVHKSQGSEFSHVALVLPDTRSPVLTRELIYTGITRAKDKFTLLESREGIFDEAILVSCKK
jgi:exodeoxyribonuclease V alpha subunit